MSQHRPASPAHWDGIPWADHTVLGKDNQKVTVRRAEMTHDQAVAMMRRHDFTRQRHHDFTWDGGFDGTRAVQLVADGDQASVAKAEKLVRELEVAMDTFHYTANPSPVGYNPRVGAFLSGEPNDMMGRRRVEDSRGPIRVYIGLDSSASIDDAILQTRGAACIALIMALSQVRPVEVWTSCRERTGGSPIDTHQLVQLSTAPLDLARICAWIGRSCVARNVLYRTASTLDGETAFNPDAYCNWSEAPEGTLCAHHAGGVAHLVIPGPFADEATKITKDPRAWVEAQLKLAMAGEGEAFEDNLAKCQGRG